MNNSSSHGSLRLVTIARLSDILASLQTSVPGIASATLASADGLTVASTLASSQDADKLSAMSGSLSALAGAMTREAGHQAPERLILESNSGHIVTMNVPAASGNLVLTVRVLCSASCCGTAAAPPTGSPLPARSRSASSFSFTNHKGVNAMAMNPKEVLNQLMQIEGAMCASLVDSGSGMLLESVGSGLDMELAAAGNTEEVRAKLKTMKSLNLQGNIEDILITLSSQYHIIRPVEKHEGLFIYLVLDRARANLAMARRKVLDAEGPMVL